MPKYVHLTYYTERIWFFLLILGPNLLENQMQFFLKCHVFFLMIRWYIVSVLKILKIQLLREFEYANMFRLKTRAKAYIDRNKTASDGHFYFSIAKIVYIAKCKNKTLFMVILAES